MTTYLEEVGFEPGGRTLRAAVIDGAMDIAGEPLSAAASWPH
ncbi:MAG: hypothetical protein R3C68_09525 [Myxococcota bacterium]